ncbi:putative acyltransferase [Gordonia namibiensis NBRC 108229]|uniref:Putative acyltransferase n=2 Tax=Gordonia namibiensis TaxID=168480 RepID=K6WHR9_9ACTN|nr:putative acyltransferase [Gordonia namibiensis NBRC 108229]
MTRILYRELSTSQSQEVSVGAFYARRARRLVPASVAVLVAIAVGTVLVLPVSRWWNTGFDILNAGVYIVNWRLADRSVEYLSQDSAPSPVQHFWSLSIEEQYYIVLPVLLALIGGAVARNRLHSAVVWLTAIAFTLSLGWSIYYSEVASGPAYFVTTTRIWELALGGLVALTAVHLARVPSLVGATLTWAGFAMILATGFLLAADDLPFPGYIALVPTVGTALMLAFGDNAGGRGAELVLRSKPVQYIGDLSYSLYLWHWPFVVIGGYWITEGLRPVTVREGVILVAASAIPAWLSYRFVEQPFRDMKSLTSSTLASLRMAVIGIAITVIVGILVATANPAARPTTAAPLPPVIASGATGTGPSIGLPSTKMVKATPMGAMLLGADPSASPEGRVVDSVTRIRPTAIAAQQDNPPVYANECHVEQSEVRVKTCTFGDRRGTVTAAIVGDSHAAQWVNALDYVAVERKWKLQSYTKSSCPLFDGTIKLKESPYRECRQWNNALLAELTGPQKPDIAFISNLDHSTIDKTMADGLASAWRKLSDAGVKVVILQDTPRSKLDVPPECVATHVESLSSCATPRNAAITYQGRSQREAAGVVPGVVVVDMTDWICPGDQCPVVIGGVLIYRDKTHMTATYSASLGPILNQRLGSAVS